MEHPKLSISMAYATALMTAGGVLPLQAANLLAELDVPDDPAGQLSEQQFSLLYRSLAVALDDELIGLCSRPMPAGALKHTCLALMDAKTLMVALHRWSCMYRVTTNDLRLRVTTNDGIARIAIERTPTGTRFEAFAVEMVLKLAHGLSSWLVGRQLPLLRVNFHFARPAFADDYKVLYPGPVRFDQEEPSIEMEARFLQLPIRRSRPQLDEFLKRAPEDWIFTRQRKPPRLSIRLRDHLAEMLPNQVKAESAAEALAVSGRTMHRRLTEEGTSFQRVKDEVRRDRAKHLLAKTELPMGSISEELGFDNVASFHRAFRSWTGYTPGAFRSHEYPTI